MIKLLSDNSGILIFWEESVNLPVKYLLITVLIKGTSNLIWLQNCYKSMLLVLSMYYNKNTSIYVIN